LQKLATGVFRFWCQHSEHKRYVLTIAIPMDCVELLNVLRGIFECLQTLLVLFYFFSKVSIIKKIHVIKKYPFLFVCVSDIKCYGYRLDVVEWSRALDVRLSEWCCSVSMVWVQIPSREEQKLDTNISCLLHIADIIFKFYLI
jgi:hypothetical protein